jgi:hypothetical protein
MYRTTHTLYTPCSIHPALYIILSIHHTPNTAFILTILYTLLQQISIAEFEHKKWLKLLPELVHFEVPLKNADQVSGEDYAYMA